MENNAKLAIENQKTPNREICRFGRSFSTAFKHHVNKNIYEKKQPSSEYLLPQKRKAISNKASRRQRWIPNAIAGWAVLLNNRICAFRDLSHGSCLFFFFHTTVNYINDENEKCITQNYFFCIFWTVPYLVRMKVLSPFSS